jgi:DNA-binding HxlR family transcriptional regulator
LHRPSHYNNRSNIETRSHKHSASVSVIPGGAEQHGDSETCKRGDVDLARAFDLLGQRWCGVVLGNLSTGPAGFRELARAIGGISDSMLSARLTTLAEAGLVIRTVEEGPPLSVTYALTDSGHALVPALAQISRWAEEHLPEPDATASG